MSDRINYQTQSPGLFKRYLEFSLAFNHSSLEETIRDLVDLRASQINGCAFCVDMHVKAATQHGERPLRLHHLPIWRESPLFNARERAALAWTEILTQLPSEGVSEDAYREARVEFSEQELTDLTFLVMAINGWNRLNIAFQITPGSSDRAYGVDRSGLT